jgi:hypothetical protein
MIHGQQNIKYSILKFTKLQIGYILKTISVILPVHKYSTKRDVDSELGVCIKHKR